VAVRNTFSPSHRIKAQSGGDVKALSKPRILLASFGYNEMRESVRRLMARSRPGSGRCRGSEVRSDHELLVLRSRLGSGRCWGNEVRSDHELLVLPFMMQCHPMRKEDDPTVGGLRVSPMGDNRVCAWEAQSGDESADMPRHFAIWRISP
jgi:hypothetical protein